MTWREKGEAYARHPQINLRLEPALVERLRIIAKKNRRTLTAEIETLLEWALEYREYENTQRRAALIRMEVAEAGSTDRIAVRSHHHPRG